MIDDINRMKHLENWQYNAPMHYTYRVADTLMYEIVGLSYSTNQSILGTEAQLNMIVSSKVADGVYNLRRILLGYSQIGDCIKKAIEELEKKKEVDKNGR